MMFNKTSALMLQTIMVLMEKQNLTMDATHLASSVESEGQVERCYGEYGCFSVAYPWVTDTRPVNLFPDPPENLNVRFAVFTRRNMRVPLVLEAGDAARVRSSNIDRRGPFYLVSHGYMESGDKAWIQKMSEALLHREGNAAATVIVVDWRRGASPPYTQAVANIRLVGVVTAHLVHLLYSELELPNLDNFHYIGHSLGAHLGGYCGHTLQKRFGLKLGRITGLDPAEPHFAKTVSLVRLDRSDAQYVDIVHSDATAFINGGFGISESIGHVDFFPNGGNNQPGCNEGVMNSIQYEKGSIWNGMRRLISCNHIRSYQFFTESVAPSCPFYTIQCPSYAEFAAGNCSKCDREHVCLPFGFNSHGVYQRLLESGLVSPNASVAMYSMTSDGDNGTPFCRVHYKVTFRVSSSANSSSEGDVGQLVLVFLDAHGNRSDHVPLDKEGGMYHKPGSESTVMVAARATGAAPASLLLEFKYETNFVNLLTWRLLSSPRIHIDWIKVRSMEYNIDFKACPANNTPVVANVPSHLEIRNCLDI